MMKLEMKFYNVILIWSNKYISISSNEIDKYEYLTGEEILPFWSKKNYRIS